MHRGWFGKTLKGLIPESKCVKAFLFYYIKMFSRLSANMWNKRRQRVVYFVLYLFWSRNHTCRCAQSEHMAVLFTFSLNSCHLTSSLLILAIVLCRRLSLRGRLQGLPQTSLFLTPAHHPLLLTLSSSRNCLL